MRKSLLLVIIVSALSMTGCDFFRILAGRPTSEDIENKKVEIMRAEEAALQFRLDSLKHAQQMVEDSLAVLDSLKQQCGTILNPSALGGLFTTKLEADYYIVVGAFNVRSNAERLLKSVADRGYVPVLINFRNGKNAVGLCPSNSLQEIFIALKEVKEEPFCPPDVWILENK